MHALADTFLNKVVTPIVEVYTNASYAARQIAPVVTAGGQEFAYRAWDTSHMRYVSTRVGERGKARPLDVGMAWVEDKTIDHRGELFVPKRIIDSGERHQIRYLTEEAELAAETMLIEEEVDFATWMTNASNFTLDSSPGTKWGTAGGVPDTNINTAIEAVHAQIGHDPNSIAMTGDVFRMLVSKYVRSADGFQPQGTRQALLDYFGADCLTNLVVCKSTRDASKKGQTKSMSGIWGSANCWVYYSSPTPSRSAPAFASTFVDEVGTYTDGEISKNPPGQLVYIHRSYVQKVRNETACYYFHSVL